MNISNKYYRDIQKNCDVFNGKKNLDDIMTKAKLRKIEEQGDSALRELAKYIGRLIGYVLFKKQNKK